MLKKETIEALAGVGGVTAEELTAAIGSEEEMELALKIVKPLTEEQQTTRTNNILKEAIQRYSTAELEGVVISGDTPEDMIHSLGKTVYDDSHKAALEMGVKKWKETNTAEFSGKDLDSLVTFVKSQKADTGELEKTIEGLRKNILQKDTDTDTMKADYEKRLNGNQISQRVMDSIPDNLVDTIKKDQVKQLFLATYQVEAVDGKEIVKQHGDIVKDKQLLNPLTLDQVMSEFLTTNKWLGVKKVGRGGTDEGGKVTGKEHIIDKKTFFEYCKENNIHGTSRQALEVLKELPKEVQEKVTA